MSISEMDGFFVLDSENSVVEDKPKEEKILKGSFGSVARKRLADISNLPQRAKPSTQDENSQFVAATTTKDYIDQLQKENMALMKLLADRNKLIELSGMELQKLRVNLQKMQQQNLQLAQSNSQMLAELNSGKDRLKALQHELGCKNGLLIVKRLESEVEVAKYEEMGASKDNTKPCSSNRGRQSKSLGPSTVKQVQDKEKAQNKRLVVRRQSARFKSEEPKPTEDVFEIEDAKLPLCPVRDDQIQEEGSISMCLSVKKEEIEADSPPHHRAQEFGRSSIGRPLRQAAKKVHSYKEIPLKVKMRRNE